MCYGVQLWHSPENLRSVIRPLITVLLSVEWRSVICFVELPKSSLILVSCHQFQGISEITQYSSDTNVYTQSITFMFPVFAQMCCWYKMKSYIIVSVVFIHIPCPTENIDNQMSKWHFHFHFHGGTKVLIFVITCVHCFDRIKKTYSGAVLW